METETPTLLEFPTGGKDIVEQILVSEKEIHPTEQECESHSQGSIRKVNHLSKII